MIQKKVRILGMLSAMLCCGAVSAQQHEVEMIPFGNMDQWIDRQIKESGIIGGATKNVYAIGPTATVTETKAYKNMGGSPWATSNVMARVAGITKTNTSVFPEKRGDGFCARMDTRMESVKVFGIVDITVLAAGSMFLGEVHEPIKGTKNPQKMLNSGIPFTKKPIAIQFDYKVKMSDREKRIRATGFSRITDVEGKDFPEVNLFLQKRDRIMDITPDWVHTGKDENGISMNEYFISHSQMILGKMENVSGPFGMEAACLPFPDKSLEELLHTAVSEITGRITDYEREDLENETVSIPADNSV